MSNTNNNPENIPVCSYMVNGNEIHTNSQEENLNIASNEINMVFNSIAGWISCCCCILFLIIS